MADRALLFYGFQETDAKNAASALSVAIGIPIDIISASGNEEKRVSEILEDNQPPFFELKDASFVMFLGFDDSEILVALRNFPTLSAERPIFCTLTTNNISWTIAALAKHLIEEDKAVRGRQRSV
jgi:hypothetical protein